MRNSSSRNHWKEGAGAAWPIGLGYIPVGLAFGVLAHNAGLSPGEIGLMSLLVYAGSSQFIAVSMLGGGSAMIPIVLTTLTVNLRHLLMSSALAVHLRGLGVDRLSLFAYGVTDESFALNIVRFREEHWDWRRALILNQTANLVWIASTVAGGYGGRFIPAGAFGIDFALPAMFLCLLVMQLRRRLYAWIAVFSGFLAVVLSLCLPGNAHVVAASAAAATLGVFLQRRRRAGEVRENP